MRWAGSFDELKLDFDGDPMNQLFGFTLVARGEGTGRVRLTRTPETPTGIGGSVQGGILAALVDIAMLIPVFSSAWLPGPRSPPG